MSRRRVAWLGALALLVTTLGLITGNPSSAQTPLAFYGVTAECNANSTWKITAYVINNSGEFGRLYAQGTELDGTYPIGNEHDAVFDQIPVATTWYAPFVNSTGNGTYQMYFSETYDSSPNAQMEITFPYSVDEPNCPGEPYPDKSATEDGPRFVDRCGTANDSVVIGSGSVGVTYKVNGSVRGPGTYHATGRVVVTATAKSGYTLAGLPSSWSHTFTNLRCVTAKRVVFYDRAGTVHDHYVVPVTAHVAYTRNGHVLRAGSHHGSGLITVVAVAAHGYQMSGTRRWSHRFSTR